MLILPHPPLRPDGTREDITTLITSEDTRIEALGVAEFASRLQGLSSLKRYYSITEITPFLKRLFEQSFNHEDTFYFLTLWFSKEQKKRSSDPNDDSILDIDFIKSLYPLLSEEKKDKINFLIENKDKDVCSNYYCYAVETLQASYFFEASKKKINLGYFAQLTLEWSQNDLSVPKNELNDFLLNIALQFLHSDYHEVLVEALIYPMLRDKFPI
jgi:hypothetical protein